MKDSIILLNEEPLAEVFIPTRLLHRDGQLREILSYLRPALHGRDARNVLVVGGPGIGKTTLVRWLLHEYFDGKFAYVNCLNARSEHKILESILIQLGNAVPENKPTDSLIQTFSKKVNKRVVVCLDEVDQVKGDRVLQTLSAQECGLILISNRLYFLDSVEDRLRSRLFLTEVEFPRYRRSELIDIIQDRIDYALSPGAITKHLVEIVAIWANGDARIALQTLKSAAMNAESGKRDSISIEDLKNGIKGAKRSKFEYVRSKLNEHQAFLLRQIQADMKIESAELFRRYQESFDNPVGERAYRNQMNQLVQTGLVRGEGEGRWRKFEVV
ncbi:MAG: AAA family ATPase [Thaumarchaeota archaeon]|nr:AAA family ATPase [Nitrososphaerota archaeon]